MPERKLTAADRPEFRRDLAKMIKELGVGTADLDQEMTIICVRAADFNPNHNVLWELDANKSAVRNDVHCFGCNSTLAMSNEAYGRYSAFDKKPRASCVQCMLEVVKREEAP
jgi:hypothetical protein